MGKKKYIIIAIIIFVMGFGICLSIAAKDRFSENLPEEQIIKMGTEEEYSEGHYFIPD